jgi:hypothetical protein
MANQPMARQVRSPINCAIGALPLTWNSAGGLSPEKALWL